MLLPVPSGEQEALSEGPLELIAPEDERERGERRVTVDEEDVDTARDIPVTRIEPPFVRPIAEVVPAAELPPGITNDREHSYLVARFDCSLRPRADKVQIEWARFRVVLQPDEESGSAVAEDMYPWRIEREVKRNVSLKISPSIKFAEAEVALGELASGYDYTLLEPVIEGAGRGGSDLTWDYSAAREQMVSGGKRMYALLRVPSALCVLDAKLEISADLRVARRFLWPARARDDPSMRVRVWESTS